MQCKWIRDPEFRRYAAEGQLVAVTATKDFAAPFTIGNAMARNKLIYGLAEFAVVAATDLENGGTWAGAKEDLEKRWAPLFVRADEPVSPGNAALLKAGALPLRGADLGGDCIEVLRQRAAAVQSRQTSLAFGG